MKLVIGLFIALLIAASLLWGSIFIGGSLYERISAFPFFSTPLWQKYRGPAIAVGVVGFIALLLAANSYNNRRIINKAAEYAEAQGWGFSRKDTIGLAAAFEELYTRRDFTLDTIRIVETGARNLYLADYYSTFKGNSSNTSWGTACMIQSDAFKSIDAPLYISDSYGMFDKMLSERVDLGNSPFAQEFTVESKNAASAQLTLTPTMQSILLDHLKKPFGYNVGVVIGPRGALLLTSRTLDHACWQFLLEFARSIEAAMR